LVVAGGVLTAPDYTRTCTCSYQNQSSVALYPDPDAEMWTYQGSPVGSAAPIWRLGVLFGAPGNRLDDNGTLWLAHPRPANSPDRASTDGTGVEIRLTPGAAGADYFRQHSGVMTGPLPWVCASGAVGLQSVAVTLGNRSAKPRRYTVRLYFGEPEDLRPGDRPFSVSLQGQEVLDHFDVAKEAPGRRRGLVKQFAGVLVRDQLVVTLKPCGKRPPILSGLEIVADESSRRVGSL
jgi:hypothetical protein